MFALIRSTLAEALKTVDGFNVYEALPSTPAPPCLSIEPAPNVVDFDDEGMDLWRAHVLFLAARTSSKDAQYRIDTGLPRVRAAIRTFEPDIGPLCNPTVKRGLGYGSYTIGGVDFLGVRLEVTFQVDPIAEAE